MKTKVLAHCCAHRAMRLLRPKIAPRPGSAATVTYCAALSQCKAKGEASVMLAMRFLEFVTAERTHELQAATPDDGQVAEFVARDASTRTTRGALVRRKAGEPPELS